MCLKVVQIRKTLFKNILIHIGYHKTGTTWLQEELFNSTEINELDTLSVTETKHSTLAFHFIYDKDQYLLSPFDNNEDNIKQHIEDIICSKAIDNEKTWVMSHERLSGYPSSGGFDSQSIANRIKNIFPNAKIFIVIREQVDLITSVYFQYLKEGGVKNIFDYLNTSYDGMNTSFSPHHFYFNNLIQYYSELFGKEKLIVLPYELLKNDPSNFIKELEKTVNQNINIDESSYNVYMNKTSDYYIKYNFRRLNKYLIKSSLNNYSNSSNKWRKKIVKVIINSLSKIVPLSWDLKTKIKIQKEVKKWAGDRYIESNRELEKLINKDLKKYNYH